MPVIYGWNAVVGNHDTFYVIVGRHPERLFAGSCSCSLASRMGLSFQPDPAPRAIPPLFKTSISTAFLTISLVVAAVLRSVPDGQEAA